MPCSIIARPKRTHTRPGSGIGERSSLPDKIRSLARVLIGLARSNVMP